MRNSVRELIEFSAIVGPPAVLVSAGALLSALTGEVAVAVVALWCLWFVVFTYQLFDGRWTDRGEPA
jgi:hypothetical protein